MNKQDIIKRAEEIADKYDTHVKIGDYTQNGNWTSISFAVDGFGGTYVNINLNNETLLMRNWVGSSREQVVTLENLEELVRTELVKEKAVRHNKKNLDYISAFID